MTRRTDLLSQEFFLKLSRLSYYLEKKASLEEGLSHSTQQGGSFEFEDYRAYHPGDDLRHLDWNVYARIEKFYLKRFARERDQFFAIFIDINNRMDFGDPNKFDLALQLAAGMAYLALHQKSRVKIFAGNTPIQDSKMFRDKKQIKNVLQYLMNLVPQQTKEMKGTLRRILPHRPQTSIFISDFFEPNLLHEFQFLLERKLSYGLIQILAQEEEHPSLLGWWHLKSLETGEIREVRLTQHHLERYQRHLAQYRETLRNFSVKHRLPFLSRNVALPFEKWMELLHLEGSFFSR